MLGLAEHIAGWSKDPSTGVGCVITDARHRILSVGFNGFPTGVKDTDERMNNRETKLMLTQHAERNAIAFAAHDLTGATAYVWPMPPCSQCGGALIQAGISRIVATEPSPAFARWGKDIELSMEMYREAGICVDLMISMEGVTGVPLDFMSK